MAMANLQRTLDDVWATVMNLFTQKIANRRIWADTWRWRTHVGEARRLQPLFPTDRSYSTREAMTPIHRLWCCRCRCGEFKSYTPEGCP